MPGAVVGTRGRANDNGFTFPETSCFRLLDPGCGTSQNRIGSFKGSDRYHP